MAQSPPQQQQGYAQGTVHQGGAYQSPQQTEERDDTSWFFRIFGFVWDNLGTMLLVGVAFFALWTFARGDDGKKWIDENILSRLGDDTRLKVYGLLNKLGIEMNAEKTITDMPIPELQKFLTDTAKIPGDVVNVIAPDAATRDKFFAAMKKGNGGKLTLSTEMLNENSLLALMTDAPEIVRGLAPLLKTGMSTNSDFSRRATASLKKIFEGEGLTTLFNPQNRANTVALLKSVKPQGVNDAQIDAIIAKNVDTDGTVKPALRTALLGFLTGQAASAADNKQADATSPAPGKTPLSQARELLSLDQIITTTDPNSIQDPTAKAVLTAAKAKPALLLDLAKQVGEDALMDAMAASNPQQALTQLLLQPKNLNALSTAEALRKAVPDLQKSIPVDLGALQNFLTTTGMKADGTAKPALTTLLNSLSTADFNHMETVSAALRTYSTAPGIGNNPRVNTQQALLTLLNAVDKDQLDSAGKTALANAIQTAQSITQQQLAAAANATAAMAQAGTSSAELLAPFKKGSEYVFTLGGALRALSNDSYRDTLKKLNIDSLGNAVNETQAAADKIPSLTTRNMRAVIRYVEDFKAANPGQNAAPASKILGAFVQLIEGPKAEDAFKNISAAELNTFFANPKNLEALRRLTDPQNGLDVNTLPREAKAVITGLWENLGTEKAGFAHWLSTPNGARVFLDQINSHKPSGALGSSELGQRVALWWYSGTTDIEYVVGMGQALRDAGITLAPESQCTRAGCVTPARSTLKPTAIPAAALP